MLESCDEAKGIRDDHEAVPCYACADGAAYVLADAGVSSTATIAVLWAQPYAIDEEGKKSGFAVHNGTHHRKEGADTIVFDRPGKEEGRFVIYDHITQRSLPMKAFMRVLIAGMVLFAVPAFAQTAGTTDTNMEILMEKLKADKKLLVASNMELTEAEGKSFWPLYETYQKDLKQINDRLAKTIGEYAEAYNQGKGTISNDTAKKLLNEAISIEEQEVKMKRANWERVGKVLPAAKTARYIQIENKIRAVIKFELARQIPLVY